MRGTGFVLWGVKCVGCKIVGESWVLLEEYPMTMLEGSSLERVPLLKMRGRIDGKAWAMGWG